MKTDLTINELKKIDHNVFKGLNERFGYDFQKDFDVLKIEGPFTINKILKETGKNPADFLTVILVLSNTTFYKDDLNAVLLYGTGAADYNVERQPRNWNTKTKLDNYFKKSSFEDERKKALAAYIIIQAKNELARTYKEPAPDLSERLTDAQQEKVIYNRTHSGGYYYIHKEEPAFDKSGYLLTDKRDNLKRRAEGLRQDRKKAAFIASDNSAIITDLEKELETAKTAVIDKVKLATTKEDFKKIESSLSWYKGLGDAAGILDRLKTGEKEKTFKSLDSFNNYVNDFRACIKKAEEALL